MWIVVAVLGICAFMSTVVQWFTVVGCRQEVEQLAPEYAAKLYLPFYDQLFKRDAISLRVLFLLPVPSSARATIGLLRQVCAFSLVTSAGFFIAMFAMLITAT